MAITSLKTKTKKSSLLVGNEFFNVNDYDSIATVNGTGSSTIVTFTNIPQTYAHLQVRANIRTAVASTEDTIYVYNYNNNTGSTNSAFHFLAGDGTSYYASSGTGSYSTPIGYAPGASATANAYGSVIFDIFDYTSTNKNKTTRAFFGYDTSGYGWSGYSSGMPVALGTGAVTTLAFAFNGNITALSSFALYGIRGA